MCPLDSGCSRRARGRPRRRGRAASAVAREVARVAARCITGCPSRAVRVRAGGAPDGLGQRSYSWSGPGIARSARREPGRIVCVRTLPGRLRRCGRPRVRAACYGIPCRLLRRRRCPRDSSGGSILGAPRRACQRPPGHSSVTSVSTVRGPSSWPPSLGGGVVEGSTDRGSIGGRAGAARSLQGTSARGGWTRRAPRGRGAQPTRRSIGRVRERGSGGAGERGLSGSGGRGPWSPQ